MAKTLFIFLLISVQVFSQEIEKNEKVNNFTGFLKTYAEDEVKKNTFEAVDDSEIKKFIKYKYEAYCADSKLLIKILKNHAKQLKDENKKGSRLSVIEGMFHKVIAERYSENFWNFLSIPYLIKATIVSISDTVYNIKINDTQTMPFYVTELEFIADEIVKGNNYFKAGNTYRCYYGPGWKSAKVSFVSGESYLLPIEPRDNEPEGTTFVYALICYLDDNTGYFKIENNVLHDKYNFFAFGEEIPWTDFVDKFNKKADSIKKGEF